MANATVVLQGSRIEAVGPQGAVRVPTNAQVIDGRGLFVLPGFVDVNVHLSFVGVTKGDFVSMALPSRQEVAEVLKYGVTTIRDSWSMPLEGVLAMRDSLRVGSVLGPRMLAAGYIVGWHPVDLNKNDQELTTLGVDSLRIRVRQYIDNGIDFLKYGATSHTNDKINFSNQAQRAIVEEVHKRSLLVETHATGEDGLRMAVLAGVDLVQHAEYSSPSDTKDGRPWSDSLVQLLIEHRVICALLPSRYDGSPFSRILSINRQKLVRAGCTIAVTSDHWPGKRTLEAIQALVMQDGMSPMDVIVAATRNGALACKMLDQFGTIEPGKLADLVVLRADPLQDIKNIERTAIVFREGRRIDVSP